jgi:hypothetical protein
VTQLEPTARTRCPIPKLTWREGLASDSGKYGSKKRLKRVPTQPKETNHEKSMMRRRKEAVFFFFLQRLASIIVIIIMMMTLLSVYYGTHRELVCI